MSCLPLPEHGKFCDLNVPFESVAATGKKLAMLVQLGYEVVAFSKFLESSASAGKSECVFQSVGFLPNWIYGDNSILPDFN